MRRGPSEAIPLTDLRAQRVQRSRHLRRRYFQLFFARWQTGGSPLVVRSGNDPNGALASELRERGVLRPVERRSAAITSKGVRFVGRGVEYDRQSAVRWGRSDQRRSLPWPARRNRVERALAEVQALRAKRSKAEIVDVYQTDLLRNLMYDRFGIRPACF